jgi:hypothetical protein
MLVEPRFNKLGRFYNGLAAATCDGKAGHVRPDGEWAYPPIYIESHRFFGELAVVRNADAYSYVRGNGEPVWTSEPHAMTQHPPFDD